MGHQDQPEQVLRVLLDHQDLQEALVERDHRVLPVQLVARVLLDRPDLVAPKVQLVPVDQAVLLELLVLVQLDPLVQAVHQE